MRSQHPRSRIFAAIGLALLGSTPALAQTSTAEEDKQDPTTLDNVTVSASRIDRPGFDAPTPTLQVSAEELRIASRPNVAAALNDLPQFRATTSPQTTGTNTDAGRAPLDLRGLGISRTLVLLDGRRFASDNDLNTIPSIVIGRVDTVTGGASAAWGSGAVGGVVNLAVDEEFVGTKLDLHGGISDLSDSEEQGFGIATGVDFAEGRGHFVFGAEYLNNEGIIPKTDRKNIGRWAQVSNGDGSYTTMPDVGFSNAAYGGLITTGVLAGMAFNPDGSLRDFSEESGPSNDDVSPLTTPQRHYSLLGRVTYDVSDQVKMTAELRHSRMYNRYVWFGDHSRGTTAMTIGIDNAFLPDAVREAMEAAGETEFTLGRFNNDFAYPDVDFERKTTQGTIAFDGSFGDGWRWSAYYSHGEHDNNIAAPGFIITENLANAVDSVIDPSSGEAVCRIALTDPSTNCVPINVFGEGAPSDEATAYVTGTPWRKATNKLDIGGVSLRGEPLELPAGPLSVAVGLEARKESIRQIVSELDAAGAFTTWSSSPMDGEYFVREAFGEVLVPVVRDVPGLRQLEFNAAARFSDYDTTGSIWSWKLGLTNEFFEGFKGRFTRSRDIRSANLTELYTSSTTGYNTITDPVTNSSEWVLTNGGGNPDLVPETADTLTVGFTWSPPSVFGLSMSLDYFKINIDDVITTVSAQDIVTRCANGNADMCARVTRDADGKISRIVSSYVNLAEYKTAGIDAEVAYTLPLSRISEDLNGGMNFRLLGTWVDSLTTDDGVSEIEYVKSQGYSFGLGVPRLRLTGDVGYQGSSFGANVRARYLSAGNFNNTVNLTNNHIGSYVYWDIGARYRLSTSGGTEWELYANVNNLFDKQPPFGSLYSPYYDVVGRYYTVGARINF